MDDKTPVYYDSTGELREVSLKKRHYRKVYTAWCIVLGVLTAAGLGTFMGLEAEWGLALLPLIALCLTMLSWCLPALFWFSEHYETLLAKSFKRTIKTSMFIPLWLLWLTALMAIPVSTEVLASNLADGLGYLLAAALMTIIPVSALTCGVVGVGFGIYHWRNTAKTESHLYREGPFALALILLIAEAALSAWMFSFLLA